ncbi:hypothetical protein [Sinomonas cyclohexanicum]|uniref:hypothetical protein n=1 Tax=Sinomonas cyclohexanicum TaxID=322009 RepID=UPI001E644E29|nr:hypothetical protein [Corynebacterium cyclohexanicum]
MVGQEPAEDVDRLLRPVECRVQHLQVAPRSAATPRLWPRAAVASSVRELGWHGGPACSSQITLARTSVTSWTWKVARSIARRSCQTGGEGVTMSPRHAVGPHAQLSLLAPRAAHAAAVRGSKSSRRDQS